VNSHSPFLLFAEKSTNELLKRTILTPKTCKPQKNILSLQLENGSHGQHKKHTMKNQPKTI